MRKIKVTVGKTVASEMELLEDVAPETAEALWQSLPVEGTLTHARWAGSACWLKTDSAPIATLREVEHPVASIYPGVMVVRPNSRGVAEIFIAYGTSESRNATGRAYATPVAEVRGDSDALFKTMAQTWAGGATTIRIERGEG